MSDSQQIREEIAATRGNLSSDVNALVDGVKPGTVARRQVDKVRGAAASTQDKVMGAMLGSGFGGGVTSRASDAMSNVGDAASHVGDAAANSPQLIRQQTQGAPPGRRPDRLRRRLARRLAHPGLPARAAARGPAQGERRAGGAAGLDKAKEVADHLR